MDNIGNKLEFLMKNNDDILYVNSIEELGNSIYDITKILELLQEKKMTVIINEDICLDFKNENDKSNEIIRLLNSICNIQRKRIRKSIKMAVDNGVKLGRTKLTIEKLPNIFVENLYRYNSGELNKTEFSKLCECSRPTLNRWLKCMEDK